MSCLLHLGLATGLVVGQHWVSAAIRPPVQYPDDGTVATVPSWWFPEVSGTADTVPKLSMCQTPTAGEPWPARK